MKQGNVSGSGEKGKKGKSKDQVQKIDVKSPADLKHWCEELNCTPDQLRVAIYKVGCNVESVKKYVKSLKHD